MENNFYYKVKWYHRIMCFLTGYRCRILEQCSDASFKQLAKFTGAMLVIMLIWGLIGYGFVTTYLKLQNPPQIAAGVGFVVFVIWMLERYIILSEKNWGMAVFRMLIGLVIASLGAVIADQYLLQEDIKKARMERDQKEVNRLLKQKTAELRDQIKRLDSLIADTEARKARLNAYLQKHPRIATPEVITKRDSTGKIISRTVNYRTQVNPQFEQLNSLNDKIAMLYNQRKEKENMILTARDTVEKQVQQTKGFLDEIKVMRQLIFGSREALVVWLLFFLLALFIELLVVYGKISSKSDYDHMIEFLKNRKVVQLENMTNMLETHGRENSNTGENS